jgi:hypothetical protein
MLRSVSAAAVEHLLPDQMADEKWREFKPSSTLHGVVFDILFEGLR